VTFFEGLVILSEMLRFFVFSFLYLKIRFLSMNLFFVSIEGLFVFLRFSSQRFFSCWRKPQRMSGEEKRKFRVLCQPNVFTN